MQKPIVFAYIPPPPPARDTLRLFGLPIFRESRQTCEQNLRRVLAKARPLPYLIFTPNLEMLSAAKHDSNVRALLGEADLLLPDGIGVRILSGFRVKERIAGIEIGEFLLSLAAKKGYRVFLLGGKRGVAEEARKPLVTRFPALSIVGTHHGYFEKDEEGMLAEAIRSAKADILFVCTGFPRQEDFLFRNRKALSGVRVAVGLGGSLDCWSEHSKRAPLWMQKCGLEWLYRVVNEPERIPRLLSSVRGILR